MPPQAQTIGLLALGAVLGVTVTYPFRTLDEPVAVTVTTPSAQHLAVVVATDLAPAKPAYKSRYNCPTPAIASDLASLPGDILSVPGAVRSQGGQDTYLWNTLFKHSPHLGTGFFVEFGARNGVEHSNTHFFEKVLGWRGILAEPLPAEHGSIASSRPCSAVFDGAFCPERGHPELSTGFPGWAGFRDSYDADRVALGHVETKVRIACMTLSDVLPLFGVRHINYLSADTEGSEQLILEHFPFSSITVDVIGIEVLKGTPARVEKQEKLVEFMKSKGYVLLHELDFSEDTSDVFFVPEHPVNRKEGEETYDMEMYENALGTCKLFGRCL